MADVAFVRQSHGPRGSCVRAGGAQLPLWVTWQSSQPAGTSGEVLVGPNAGIWCEISVGTLMAQPPWRDSASGTPPRSPIGQKAGVPGWCTSVWAAAVGFGCWACRMQRSVHAARLARSACNADSCCTCWGLVESGHRLQGIAVAWLGFNSCSTGPSCTHCRPAGVNSCPFWVILTYQINATARRLSLS